MLDKDVQHGSVILQKAFYKLTVDDAWFLVTYMGIGAPSPGRGTFYRGKQSKWMYGLFFTVFHHVSKALTENIADIEIQLGDDVGKEFQVFLHLFIIETQG